MGVRLLKYILLFLVSLSFCLADEQKTIAVYVQPPIADVECASALYTVLMTQHKVRMLHHITLTEENLQDADCIAFPGGLEDVDNFDQLLSDKRDIVQQFVKKGGGYLGICMGAYLADKDYFNILKDVRVEQYIKRPRADFTKESIAVLPVKWNKKDYCMYFYDGAVFVGNLNKAKVVATYLNTDAMAIIQDRIGLIGCHPESQIDWYDNKLKHLWHKEEHYKLLLDFVNLLLN
jgi:glutamine amidotransferase-like uncharacterized protein